MSEHLLVFPDRDVAEQVADELRDEGFTEVRVVREALAGEDDSESHEWGVHVVEEMVADESGPVEGGLRDRFKALVEEHDGWYDPEPDGWSTPPGVVAHRAEAPGAAESTPA
ncbi:ribonuclease E inhibitor RraB [Phycicoccus sp. M110.8]|uniref:ribonuclease E inhibitor RraB n=1 Tax=Phycicoccus sp. M110.8 TaxID=3075433 RepID=UPI0028FDA4D4|nr:ribonuclease E inhibitor RraB [Phycicoccus sp. M110.8]MDU0313515.1 ribonuclease E inhibitor RraB [Phycicoccus sp. M110.8]